LISLAIPLIDFSSAFLITGTYNLSGSVSSMGIINHPQAAILQVESIVKKPVVIDDMIAIRNV
jgi:2-oxoisovalerate dehydrogenase E2 component (dihydrolipoyl transacylase)